MTARYRILLTVFVLFAVSLACSTEPEPKEFTSESGGFTIAFPGDPETETQSVPTAIGDVQLTMYTVETGSSAYLAGYVDYPADMVASADPETMLDDGRDGAIDTIDGKLISEKSITIDGHPGRELKVEAQDGEQVLYGRFYLVDARLYEIMVVSSPGGLDEAVIFAFLNSFNLTD